MYFYYFTALDNHKKSIYQKYNFYHYCPVKVEQSFFEIIEIQSSTSVFEVKRI